MPFFEIRANLDDCRINVVGGLQTGILIWESAIIPKLLYNSECWLNISKQTLKNLENLQLRFLRMLFAVGMGCPIPILYWDTGCLPMKYRILKNKLLFLHHVATLPENTLAREIFETQKKLHLPGLLKECHDFMIKSEIMNFQMYSKQQWKTCVKNSIRREIETDLREKMNTYKKLQVGDFVSENFAAKDYLRLLNLADVRWKFKLRSSMTPTIKMNFKTDKKFAAQLWKCEGCAKLSQSGNLDTQQHVLWCEGYADLRVDMDLDNDQHLVAYFRSVISRRQNNC